MKIGVVSDTHGQLRPEALELLAGVDHIIHAGDIGSPDIIPRIRKIAPVTAVRGNVDTQPWAAEYPEWDVVTLAGRTIYVLHDIGALNLDPVVAGFEVVIFGHSHRPSIEMVHGVVYLNPGCAGPRRFKLPVTLATLDVTEDAITPRILELVG